MKEILEEKSKNLISLKKQIQNKQNKIKKKKKQEKQYSPLHFKIDNFDVYIGKNNK